MMIWTANNVDLLGYLPGFLDNHNQDSARDQLHKCYAHGGGWQPFEGFTLHNWQDVMESHISYPGDPVYREIGRCVLHDNETVIVYEYAWVAIVQQDGSYEIARMD